MNNKIKKLSTMAMLSAVAYITMVVCRIPIVLFLKYEPKDVIIVIAGFLFGPLSAFLISLLVSLIEMVTVSETGIIGCVMNLISTCTFVCPAAFIYKKKHTITGAALGLSTGCIIMTIGMLLWNYLVTPLYMGVPREAIAEMLLPVFLPFNLLKGILNLSITLLLYKPIVTTLRKTRLVPASENSGGQIGKKGILIMAAFLLITCVLLILVWTKVM